MNSKLRPFQVNTGLDHAVLADRLKQWVDHPSWTDGLEDRDEVDCRRLLCAATWSSHAAVDSSSTGDVSAFESLDEVSPPGLVGNPACDASTAGLLRFELGEVLGQGGFGIVFRVCDHRLNCNAAVKMLRPSLRGRHGFLRRFLREARAVQGLSHPGITAIYDVGAVDGYPFIVTELIEGPNMAQWLKGLEQPLPLTDAVELIREIADSVHHAHSRGILHRDLKPSNILLQMTNNEDGSATIKTKLSDFGLAKPMDSAFDSVFDLTQAREMVGTAGYMSPEQAMGKSHEVAITSDVFSLGVIMYELLTGQPPFRGSSDVEIIHSICNDEPSRPRQLNRLIPRDLEAITMQCLKPKPENRYATAAALVADLDRYLHGLPVEASNPSATRRLVASLRSNPYRTAVASLALAGAVGFIGFSQVMAARERQQQHRADRNLRLAIQGLGKTLNAISEQINAGVPVSHEMHLKILDISRQFHEDFTHYNPHDEYALYRLSVAHHYLANGHERVKDYGASISERRSALAILQQLLEREPDNVDYLFDAFMQNYLLAGDIAQDTQETQHPDAELAFDLADKYISCVLKMAPDSLDFRDAYNSFRHSLAFRRSKEAAKELHAEVTASSKALYESHPELPHLAKPAIRSLTSLSSRANTDQQHELSIEYSRQALTLLDQAYPEQSRDGTIWYYRTESSAELAKGLSGVGDWAAAESAAEETLRGVAVASMHDSIPIAMLVNMWEIRAEANARLGKRELASQCTAEVERLNEVADSP